MKKLVIGLLGYWVIGLLALVYAEEYALEKIVITPLRYAQDIQRIPAAVTVITKEEIEKSNAQTIVDLLRPVSSVVVRDYYGTGTKASVDLRGFGEFAGENTLVLIDGRRVNEIDLSGVAWTQIPLEIVEKIEIIRGMGGVLYGDNALGGVINILTKKGEGKPTFKFKAETGSFQREKYNFEMGGSRGILSYLINFNRYSTNGYRKNSDYRGEDFFGKITYQPQDGFSLTLSGNYHLGDFGLPGALRESQLKDTSRRDTKFPADDVGEADGYINLETKSKLTDSLEINTHLSFRRREVDNYLLSSQSLDYRRIDTLSLRPSAILETNLLGKEHQFMGGIDFYKVDSLIDAYSGWGLVYYQGEKMRETAIDKNSLGYYLQDRGELSERLNFLLGYRLEKAKYSFDSTPQPGIWDSDPWVSRTVVDEDLQLDEEALSFGLNYLFKENAKFYINYNRSFRLPTTDEYYSIWSTPPVNTQLLPQISHNYELGCEYGWGEYLRGGFSLFAMKLRNELYYDPLTFTNRNYDKTEHRGLELFAEKKIGDCLILNGNYTFTEAFFKGGNYAGKQIPLIPRHKASLSGNLKFARNWELNTIFNYCGERFLINDQGHNYPPLKDFFTLDLRWERKIREGNLYFTVNNLFNKKYSEYGAISTVYNERGFYPSPERNFLMGITYKF
ncbi:MAG: TonB-dependent receptor [Candidatus Omnitrophica bacterium]|nr:TonB-dependent receptor [Candidatus Omnitrophota bacterium]MCM8793038.1 TonB-dependent receptor [Candidatus Omnitrophota bacterium]